MRLDSTSALIGRCYWAARLRRRRQYSRRLGLSPRGLTRLGILSQPGSPHTAPHVSTGTEQAPRLPHAQGSQPSTWPQPAYAWQTTMPTNSAGQHIQGSPEQAGGPARDGRPEARGGQLPAALAPFEAANEPAKLIASRRALTEIRHAPFPRGVVGPARGNHGAHDHA
jgi:hypothetical protein